MRWWAAKSEAKYRALVIEKLKYTIASASRRSAARCWSSWSCSSRIWRRTPAQAETAAQMAAAQPEAEQPNVEMRSFARRAPEHPPFTDVVVPTHPKDVGCTKRAERHGRVEFEGHGRIEPRLAAWIAHGRGAS